MEGCTFKPKIISHFETIRERYEGSSTKKTIRNAIEDN